METLAKDIQKNFLNEHHNKKKFLYGWKKYTQWTTSSGKPINFKLPILKYFIKQFLIISISKSSD